MCWLRACMLIYVFYRLNFWTSWPLSISIWRWRTTQRQAFNFVILVKTIWRKWEIMTQEEISCRIGETSELYSGGGRFESWPRHRLSRLRFPRLSSVPAGRFGDNITNQATKATFPIFFNTSFSNLNFRLCIILRSYINRKRINKLSWCETDTSAFNLGCYGNSTQEIRTF